MYNLRNASNVDQYNEVVSDLLENLRSKAASGDSHRKFAAANSTGRLMFQNVFAHVQCTPDLSEQQCNDCLVEEIFDVTVIPCEGKIRCRIWKPSCTLRFDTSPYFDPNAAAEVETPSPLVPAPSSIVHMSTGVHYIQYNIHQPHFANNFF